MTLREYFETPESVTPQELIYGAMRVAESPTPMHQAAVGSLYLTLHEHVVGQRLGQVWLAPLDVVLDADGPLVVQPDLFVILNGGAATVSQKVFGAPDLVVEVLSPTPRIGDTDERVTWFRDHGVRECWLVHQLTGRVEVLHFKEGQVRLRTTHARIEPIRSGVLPDFERSLSSIMGYVI
ncbi:MAG TPA: Uma2 family endonuclease [Vicinamibacterales bacterium]|jgi:Uma2 family endonuclease|nr:Uma2 family endonuclease [Acidobacteriota bacterium]HQX81351.1 Uma2 family endonuclease [Vicinamibacterales bacterium]